jgi:glyoxylase-like metal-dependent hydrolase (beta-lactamase superfamily II)
MTEIKVLIEGIHENGEKLKASSTVTLVKSDKNIIIDTGSFQDEQKIIDALAKEGLKPEDIDIVVLTHLHIDHTRNTNIFSNAVLYVKHSNAGTRWDINNITVAGVELENLEIAEDVKIILTPGHFPYHASVVVETKDRIVIIAGDAVQTEESLGKIPYPQWDDEKYLENQKKILQIADYVIPGHGKMFKVKK